MNSIANQPQPCKPYRIKPDRLTLEYSKTEGYEILTFGDGYGEVLGSDGQHYTISNFRCSCPDSQHNDGGSYHGYCKHSWWLSQLHTCEKCGSTSEMKEIENIRNNHHRFAYVCSCGDVLTVKEVHAIRKRHQQEAQRATAIERAEQASQAIFSD